MYKPRHFAYVLSQRLSDSKYLEEPEDMSQVLAAAQACWQAFLFGWFLFVFFLIER